MKTSNNTSTEQELFDLILVHQQLIKLEYALELVQPESKALESLASAIENLNSSILSHPFWKTEMNDVLN